jgi:hypothetical protein
VPYTYIQDELLLLHALVREQVYEERGFIDPTAASSSARTGLQGKKKKKKQKKNKKIL